MGAAAELDRALFVGNLDPRVTEELIFELFHQAGPVIKVKIPKDRDGRPKQFAFVNFKHEESVPYGLNLLNGIKLYGRPIKIQFRSGSSHAAQGSCSLHGSTSTSTGPLGAPQPASTGSRYDRSPDGMVSAGFPSAQRSLPPADNLQRQAMLNSAQRLQPHFGGKYEQPGFSPPGYQHPAHSLHPTPGCPLPRRPELLRKGRLGAHPYHPDGRHASREQPRFGERGHDHEHRYRASREEPGYDDWHRDSWSHDYRREPRWHPARH
uniref:RNA-binding protein 7 n=1 Tax=Amazona collaria TaxID=241587 RepID=A0A8B9FBS2_9PSIT